MEFDDDPTHLDELPPLHEPDTEKHRSLDYLVGREQGFSEGVDKALAALKYELSRVGLVGVELDKILNRIRTGALERG